MQTHDWYQQQLTPSEVYELNLRLGVIPESDHVQVMVELKDPITSVLIAQWSIPHGRLDTWTHTLDIAHAKATEMLGAAIDPF